MTCSCPSCHLPDTYVYFKELTDEAVEEPQCSALPGGTLTTKQSAIKAHLLEYRRQLCERALVPSASLILGIEIATGVPDSVMDCIVKDYTLVECREDLIKICVTSHERADMFFGILS